MPTINIFHLNCHQEGYAMLVFQELFMFWGNLNVNGSKFRQVLFCVATIISNSNLYEIIKGLISPK